MKVLARLLKGEIILVIREHVIIGNCDNIAKKLEDSPPPLNVMANFQDILKIHEFPKHALDTDAAAMDLYVTAREAVKECRPKGGTSQPSL